MDGVKYLERFSPDGLSEDVIDAWLPFLWPQHPSQRPTPRCPAAGYGLVLSGHDTRPAPAHGDLNRSVPATKEVGMLQLHACVIIRCDQCGDHPGGAGHYPAEDAALEAATAAGWQVGPGGQLWCSVCATVLTCEADGHEFTAWRHPVTANGQPALSEYRHCRRCCLDECRPATRLIGSVPRHGKSAAFPSQQLRAGTVAAEVA